jgi:heat shock protein HtpX
MEGGTPQRETPGGNAPFAAEERICPGCGTANHRDAAYCNLCQKSFLPAGVSRFAGEPAGGSPGATGPLLRPAPMLSFYEAASRNVWMSWVLFLALFTAFLAIGGGIGGAYGSVGYGVALALILYAILAATAYFNGSSLVLSIHSAREADPADHRRLRNVVEEMSIASGIPMPRVYVMESPGMNAFAAGRNPQESLVAVTTGLFEKLNREELQGVIAHEMAHIKSRDTLYNICAAVLVGTIALLADMFLRGMPFRGRTRSGGGGRGNIALLGLGIVLAILAPIAAKILQMSISRQREYHADAMGAQFTRNPLGLAAALAKISRNGADVPGENRGTQHLFIVNPLRNFADDASALFSTHPSTTLRIQRLYAMAGIGSADIPS